MSSKYTCEKCGDKFRADRWTSCYNCGTPVPKKVREAFEADDTGWNQFIDSVPASASTQKSKTGSNRASDKDSSDINIEGLVRAQDRTTHAVRSLAVFFFMNLFWASIAGLLVGLASLIPSEVNCDYWDNCSRNPNGLAIFLNFLAVITALVGIFITTRLSIKELRQSRLSGTWM